MTFKNLNKQTDYIEECIKNNYMLLFRIHPNSNIEDIYYITGKIISIELENIIPSIIAIQIHDNGYILQQNNILLNLDNNHVNVLNLDEIL